LSWTGKRSERLRSTTDAEDQPGAASAFGSSTICFSPPASPLEMLMVPPARWMISRAMVSPRPAPRMP